MRGITAERNNEREGRHSPPPIHTERKSRSDERDTTDEGRRERVRGAQ